MLSSLGIMLMKEPPKKSSMPCGWRPISILIRRSRMPKLFPISIDVEEVAVGGVLRALNSMAGVVRLRLNLTQDKPARGLIAHGGHEESPDGDDVTVSEAKWRTDGRLNARGLPPDRNPAYRAIAEVLMKTPAHLKVLRLAIERVGLHRHEAINGYMHRMQALGLIKRI